MGKLLALVMVAGTAMVLGACAEGTANSGSQNTALYVMGGNSGATTKPAAKPAAPAPAQAAAAPAAKPAAAAPAPAPAAAATTTAAPAMSAGSAGSGSGASYRPAVPAGYSYTSMAFPTGDANSSAVMVHQVIPQQVRVGQNYGYELHVTNITNGTLQNVVVTNSNHQNFSGMTATPAASKATDGSAMWMLGDLAAGKTQVIKVTGKADKVGTSSNCVAVSYNNLLCAMTNVVQPALAITKTITPEVTICDPITMVIEVKNTGSGAAENVRITDALPAGLTTSDGKSALDIAVGTLAAGESKQVSTQLKASKTGKFDNMANAKADGDLAAASQTVSTVVRQPVLAIECKSQGRVFVGRDVTYTLTVTNKGDTASNATTVSAPIPSGASFVSATEGGTSGGTSGGGNVAWNVGSLAAGASKSFTFTVKPSGLSNLAINATAQGTCAAPVSTSCATEVVGIPALLLDGGDEPDPIQIGETTTYTLKVTNQGSAPLTNVKLVCTMETDAMAMVSSSEQGSVNNGVISFPAIATLAPKASRTYTVTVRATKEGQVQFKAEASSNEITRALIKTETTNFYK